MIQQISALKSLLGPRPWARQLSAWIVGIFASGFEAASLAFILPLVTLALTTDVTRIGPLTLSRETLLIGAALAYLSGLLVRMLALGYTARATLSVGYGFSAKLFGLVLEQPQAWHSRHHSSEVRTVILHDAQELMSLVTIPAGRVLAQGALVLCVGLVMLALKPLETFVAAIVVFASYCLVFAMTSQRLKAITSEQIRHHGLRHRYSTDALSAIREVRLSHLEEEFSRAFATASDAIAATGVTRTLFSELPRLMLEAVLFTFLLVFVIWFAMLSDSRDTMDLSGLMVFAFAGLKLFPMGHALYANLASLRSGQPLLEKLKAFVDALTPPPDAAAFPEASTGFALSDVSFTHPGAATPILQNISFSLGRGDSLAITGPSGSGKSTLIDIVAGLIFPDQGAVEVDGVRLSERHARSWQRQLRYCPQKPALFDLDLVGNVTNGAVLDQARLERALYIACLEDAPFPRNDYSVGELGSRLSGGQIQRIGLARALYGAAPILILDEPTSNLDATTATRFLDRLFAAQGDTILVIVTHDRRVMSKCSAILKLGRPETSPF